MPNSPSENPDGGDHSRSRNAASRGSSFDAPPPAAATSGITGASTKTNTARTNLSGNSELRNKEPDDAARHKDFAARCVKHIRTFRKI